MRHWFRARNLSIPKGWRLDRGVVAHVIAPFTWQGWTLTALWVAAMAVTLITAALEGPRQFLYAVLATGGGTAAALWMLRGRVKPAR
jgi:hypothetical protein